MSAPAAAISRARWTPIDLPDGDHRFVRASGDVFDSTDPATGEVVAHVRASVRSDVDAAVEAGRTAMRGAWRDDGALRGRVLYRYAQALRENADRIAELLTREQGKKLFEARVEVMGAANHAEYYAGQARSIHGRAMPLGPNVHGVTLREPVGVVAVITPWNWPLTLLTRSLAPALAAGNAVIVKPASLTPAVTIAALAPLAADPELPEGILSCVVGSGAVVGDALVKHPGVEMIAFTGESTTGIDVMKHAADRLKKVSLELGGKSPNVVFADAPMEKALEGAAAAAFSSSGQICTAGSRLVLQRSIADEFLSKLGARVEAMRVGDGLDPSTDVAPVVSRSQQRSILDYIELGRREGEVVAGGVPLEGPGYDSGCFVPPAVVSGLAPNARLVQEEIFGPVLAVQLFDDDDEAIALANCTEFGLAAGIWTSDLNRAWRMGREIEAGTVWINTYNRFYSELEVGGFKQSGVGRQQGVVGLEEFTEVKSLNFDANPTLW
ncbi:MAG TPA: aldehyde dehydrogenase family protein [Capillimicrobium sp.]|nr:aldehyde dehydrogenase family protein [Capillimicrobium sp.]